jgi:hypothetical protein
MVILFKLIQAVLLGLVMLLSAMLMFVAATFFIGFIAELLGFKNLAASMYVLQESMWLRIKRWFFRYKGE